MKNKSMIHLTGYLTVKVSGRGLERFINAALREEIAIWHVKRLGTETIVLRVYAKDFASFQELAAKFSVEFVIVDKSGIPFVLRRAKKNAGFIVGLLFGLAILYLLANMIWDIEIKGASPELEYKLTNQLKELGVYKGGLKYFVDDPQTLQKTLTQNNEEITWIGVTIDGTTYTFQVVEKERPEEEEKTGPRHLIAKKEAVIVDYFIEKGEPVVSINQFVRPGQMLVSGLIGKEDEPEIVSAKGKVWGKTWYKTEAAVNMKTKTLRLSGESQVKRFLQIGSVKVPIAGFTLEQYNKKEVIEEVIPIQLLRWELPIAMIEQTIYEAEEVEFLYSEEEARNLAMEAAKKDLLRQLPKDAKIVDQKVLHEQVENGTLKLSILYDVIEDIATEQLIR